MAKQLDVKGKTIAQIARWYVDNQLYVNRVYQRKLVWGIEEKKLFIDSLLSRFPTPSIILNEVNRSDETHYEIIDGVQRLDAIMSYLLGLFPIKYADKYGYFDKSAIPVIRKELLGASDTDPLLELDTCLDFADVEIPVVICNQEEHKITDIFCRINSSGKKLSLQDLRQASVVNDFSELVRRCATYIRGDYTYDDLINLCDMRKISLSGKGLSYEINHETVFWRRHEIITYNNLRQSRDEEIVASILCNILLNRDGFVNRDLLDKMYDADSMECKQAITKIHDVGIDTIEKNFQLAKTNFETIFDSVRSTFANYLFSTKKIHSKDIVFEIVFRTLYQLNYEGYIIQNYAKVANILKESIGTLFEKVVSGKTITSREKGTMYKMLHSLLKDNMIKSGILEATQEDNEIRNRLTLSSIESAMTEFKIGILKFKSPHKVNNYCIEGIVQTLVAMANTPCREQGYVVVGVADTENDANDWKKYYSSQPICFQNHYIVGIEDEALAKYQNIDKYMQAIKDTLKKLNISEPLKQYILSNVKIINFMDKQLLLLKSQRTEDDYSTLDGKVYIRNGNSTECKMDKI